VKAFGGYSEKFRIDTGFKQGCVLAPNLFNLYIDSVVRHIIEVIDEFGLKVSYKIDGQLRVVKPSHEMLVWILLYADDIALVGSNAVDLSKGVTAIADVTSQWGMDISIGKTKLMVIARKSSELPQPIVVIQGQQMEIVDKFKYLGSMICSDNSLDAEISHRLGCAMCSFRNLRKSLWSTRNIERETKMTFFNAIVMPSLLYGCECWTVLERHLAELEKFQMQCLRVICGVSRRMHTSNIEIRTKCNQPFVAETIKYHRLRWLGHLGRMPDNRIPKRVLFGKIEGKRPVGGPRKTWSDVVVKDLDNSNIRKWYKECQDKSGWREKCKL